MRTPAKGSAAPAAMMTAMLLALSLFLGESRGMSPVRLAVGPDITLPGQGTGRSGAGKGPAPLSLGKAAGFAILAKSEVTATGTTAVTGNVGISPAAGSSITGFSIIAPPSSFASSAIVTGKIFAADYDSPTPQNLTDAISDMMTAYTDAAGRAPDYIELGAGEIGGKTLAPAVYKWGTDVLISSDVTLSGGPNDVWIFQIAGNLVQASGVAVTLQGGALPRNIFWQIAGSADHATTSHFEGVELCQTGIVYKTGASANARLMAQTAVVLDANAVTEPAEGNSGIRETAAATRGLRILPMGDRWILELGPTANDRVVSVFDLGGVLKHRITVPAGKARAAIPAQWSPAKGFRFRLEEERLSSLRK